MNYIYVGKIVNTHGIKGEIRIISDFDKKEKVFIEKMNIYIGKNKEKNEIITYRKHKNYDMITLLGINSINDVLKYKGQDVYILRENLNLKEDEYLEEDLIGMEAYFNNNLVGKVTKIDKYGLNKILVINNKLIPYNEHFIKNVDFNKNILVLENVEGLI